MSEYQYVAFRAIDRPVSERNLEYMRRQSSRAEITPWSFDNEYHYGDFRGNVVEMLRRGYDIHLHYANFGIRKLLIRLPHGLPDTRELKPYVAKDSLRFLKDRKGPGGILCVEPFNEAGDLDELWEIDAILDRLVPLRAEILDGDLRPLYIAHLAVACEGEHDPEETRVAPVPASLGAHSDAQSGLAELYGLSDELIAAAAQESPPMPARVGSATHYTEWLRGQRETTKNTWLAALMADPTSAVRAEILAKYRTDLSMPTWPTTRPNRTIAQLHAAATLRETERLVAERTTDAYRRVGDLLADLREALSGAGRSILADKHAQKLKAANPRLRLLTSELRRQGFVPK